MLLLLSASSLVELKALVHPAFRRNQRALRVLSGKLLRENALLVVLKVQRVQKLLLETLSLLLLRTTRRFRRLMERSHHFLLCYRVIMLVLLK